MIAVVDYEAGNLMSVVKALDFVGAETVRTSDPAVLGKAAAVVLPGVGNFGDGMRSLEKMRLVAPIKDSIGRGVPFLGICLGMQLLMESSEEAPGTAGLSIFKGRVVRFRDGSLKIPHMGWNNVRLTGRHPLFAEVPDNSFFYFVHSYYVLPDDQGIVLGTSNYETDFAAATGRNNIFATQFHPEKSQDAGLQILRNFVKSVYSNGE